MTFWAYLLHCNGGRFYAGHTDDLERRMAQHPSGAVPGVARNFAPVTLVWNQEFQSHLEALEAERRIKGWTRAKKEALVRGDWAGLSLLARNRQDGVCPSTSSGRTEWRKSPPEQPPPVRPEPVEGRPALTIAQSDMAQIDAAARITPPPQPKEQQ